MISFTQLSTGRPAAAIGLLWLLSLPALAEPSARIVELQRQAHNGDPWAALNLGAAYDNGVGGLALDPVTAVRWYRRAAEAGLAEAQFNLAHCLATGNGTPRDDVAALRWMRRAAQQDLASAQYLLGVMLAEGIGTAVDRGSAIAWLDKAAANGNLDAPALLARLRAADTE